MVKQPTADETEDREQQPADDLSLADAINEAHGEEASTELVAANDRLLRLQAEMQNLRNRTSREIADERRFSALPLMRDLLPVLDNIDRAIEAAEKAGEADNLLEGFRLVRQQLVTTLTNHGAEPIEALGQPFDPHFHQAILHQPSADTLANSVTMVTQQGYKLHDRVVRPTQVIVSSGPA